MWRKISDFPLTAYLAVTGFFRGLKKDERGLSGVVVAILLILVAVLLILLIWGSLDGWLSRLWGDITKAGNSVKTSETSWADGK